MEAFPVQKAMVWDFDRVEVSGDLAVGSGSGIMTIEVEGQEISMPFDFTDVFRKDENGSWLYSSVIFNEKDAPA